MMKPIVLAALMAMLVSCMTPGTSHPEASPFSATMQESDARRELAVEQAVAVAESKLLLVVYGADWCHDSRALAGWLRTPRFQALSDAHFRIVYLDAGTPQKGEDRNLDLVARFGLTGVEGTPSLLVIDPVTEALLNPDTAKSWRNAASRSEDAIYQELADFAVRFAPG